MTLGARLREGDVRAEQTGKRAVGAELLAAQVPAGVRPQRHRHLRRQQRPAVVAVAVAPRHQDRVFEPHPRRLLADDALRAELVAVIGVGWALDHLRVAHAGQFGEGGAGLAKVHERLVRDARVDARRRRLVVLDPGVERQQQRPQLRPVVARVGQVVAQAARRLCEAGCGFVLVNTEFVWDMHQDQNNLGVREGMDFVGAPFDRAVAAFIEDCEARGLREKILLVATGEMGRTPQLQANGGRNHWGRLTPLFLYGGGLTRGQVIGRSTRDGGAPAAEPLNSRNLIATIMHTLFRVGEVRLTPGLPSDVLRVITENQPIPGLV
ncbi:MAG: DUF1501 domain-containing protein [Gemmataceae bacterium]|nr:DUF1501 domain-containing protein [Gemmataceae bacterium]